MTLPAKMKAITAPEAGGPEKLEIVEREIPTLSEDEVLIKVKAAGVNRPDCIQRAGNYPPPPGASDILGLEVSGEIVEIGARVTDWKVGDLAVALVSGGGYAEYCKAHHGSVLPIPKGFSLMEAASLPENLFTVWHNVFQRGALKANESLLIHGGSSGIGMAAIQLGKAFGAKVAITAGSDEKCEACTALGADLAINYKNQDFVSEIKSWTDRKGVNVILDMVGGDYISKNYVIAAEEGRIVQIAFLKGGVVEADFRRLMMKRLIHTGSTLRARPDSVKQSIARELQKEVWPLLRCGLVKPQIYKCFTMDEAAKAHELMESSQHIGKIMLEI
ncbi:NAD(P)H-quinone oxidoreductase [uncultured Cohaesibacter sp.]|uniref:NAD(P)H-quinone oxidoreductase n=1 Tax=uncultured Cohaesibacter sp. TaxID=1002546 RepID=UPI00292CA7BF|nr:NAD(P)H-quinone oxidoreductase [uncultured Cohaesibacter sp.]